MDSDPPAGQNPAPPPYGFQASTHTKAGKQRLRFAEEQRAEPPKSWKSKSISEKSIRDKLGSGPPDVYWSDDGDTNASQYTFYREGTPTPGDYPDQDRRAYGRALGAMGLGHGRAPSQVTMVSFDPPPLHPFGSRVCGMRKGLFWILVVIFGVVIIAAGVGTGVGLGVRKASTQSSSNDSSSSPSATPTGPPPSSTVTSSPATPAASFAPASAAECEAKNDTLFAVPDTTKSFKRFCGIDFSGVGGAVDLTDVTTSTMEECMISCSGFANCTGCGWGIIPGDKGPDYRCWLKSNLQTPHNQSNDWSFAILQ